jgi:nitric oxide reductase subunit B
MALAFLALALSYLALGLLFGVLGSVQYLLPAFLRDQLAFQKTRPLHVYLVISWIFTAAQGGLNYYLPRLANRNLHWQGGVKWHWLLQALTSFSIVGAFFNGSFGGREYLEFPPLLGVAIALTWLPFAINFFLTLKPRLWKAPVYFFSWTLGIIFFYITLAESYLWVFDYFSTNEVRDITVQWKALGSMVGSWNMLVYGTSMYIMEKMKGDTKMSRSPMAFFFFFLGFTNLLFNWGHHTYIVPAAPWVKTVAYVISMTELLIFGNLLLQWRKSLSNARKHFHLLPFRFLSYADAWIFLNLGVAILISIPQLNYYTHGTHITVAHAMGTTIGINTMLLFASVVYILQQQKPQLLERYRGWMTKGGAITNMALIFFWTSLVGSGLVKIASKLDNEPFHILMQKCQPFFKIFALSGAFIWLGLGIMIIAALRIIGKGIPGSKLQ